jgi:hypothetical protein
LFVIWFGCISRYQLILVSFGLFAGICLGS